MDVSLSRGTAAVLATVLMVLLVMATAPATAGPPGDNGPIVYTADGGLYVVESDGLGERLVVAGSFARPDVSPDGTAVLVTEVVGMDTAGPLISIDLDSGAKTTVHAGPALAGVWSGDGTRLAYADDEGVWVKEGDDAAVQVSEVHSDVFDWSPVDNRIIVVRTVTPEDSFPEYYLETLDVESEQTVLIADNGPGLFTFYSIDADFSPDGEDIVYSAVSPGSIAVVIAGQEMDPLDPGGAAWGGPNGYVAWSPDGSSVTYPTSVLNDAETEGVPVLAVHPVDGERDVFPSAAQEVQWSPLAAEEPPSGGFDDVDENHIFYADILWLADQGITRGCNPPANTNFCPDDFVTRGQMAAFLVRAFGYSDDGGGDLFDDDDGSVFESDIDRLATAGVTRGCNPPANTNFCPDDSVTRGQMAAFLHRAIGD